MGKVTNEGSATHVTVGDFRPWICPDPECGAVHLDLISFDGDYLGQMVLDQEGLDKFYKLVSDALKAN